MKRAIIIIALILLLLSSAWFFFLRDTNTTKSAKEQTSEISEVSDELLAPVGQEVGESSKPIQSPSGPIPENRLRYKGRSYDLKVFNPCGALEDSFHGATAASIDSDGNIEPDGAQILLQIEDGASIATISFRPDDPVLRVYKRGDDAFVFQSGSIAFSGPVSDHNSNKIEFSLTCP